jgi:hypothetical protein
MPPLRSPHIVPLATQSLEVLTMLRTLSGDSDWLFPGDRDPKKSMSNNTILKALERMKYKGKMTGHGFRGLASTVLHEKGYPHEHIEFQLAHMPRNAVSAAYNHAQYLEPRATMMQEWAELSAQADGRSEKRDTKVRAQIDPDLIEHQLAHAVRDPSGRAYKRTAHLPERRRMMQEWADYLDKLKLAEVVPIHRD